MPLTHLQRPVLSNKWARYQVRSTGIGPAFFSVESSINLNGNTMMANPFQVGVRHVLEGRFKDKTKVVRCPNMR
jgi:hypothetical protein